MQILEHTNGLQDLGVPPSLLKVRHLVVVDDAGLVHNADSICSDIAGFPRETFRSLEELVPGRTCECLENMPPQKSLWGFLQLLARALHACETPVQVPTTNGAEISRRYRDLHRLEHSLQDVIRFPDQFESAPVLEAAQNMRHRLRARADEQLALIRTPEVRSSLPGVGPSSSTRYLMGLRGLGFTYFNRPPGPMDALLLSYGTTKHDKVILDVPSCHLNLVEHWLLSVESSFGAHFSETLQRGTETSPVVVETLLEIWDPLARTSLSSFKDAHVAAEALCPVSI